ncbi:MAG: glutamine amidotransferase [Candidatus Eremiobacteraeota bacterium]|nr:glutamine amidotransferase [Candidatus Eremiobacteraeota bacterium]
MCRVLGYLGEPVSLRQVLFDTDSSLVAQSYSPRMMNTFLNLAGFGMAAWEPQSARPEEPFVYRTTMVPTFDRNLRGLARKLEPTCLIAHVRGVTYGERELVGASNLHPFRFPGTQVTLAHNGHLREFRRMRFELIKHILPEFAEMIEGTTDSEWIYALVLSQLDDPSGCPEADELAQATMGALRVLRDVRALERIDVSSPVNLFVTTGESLVVTRFSYDYGWYPPEDTMLEIDLPYVSLWYTVGGRYAEHDGEHSMVDDGSVRSLLIASEPLTIDVSTWREVPEYSMITAWRTAGALEYELLDLVV